MTTLHLIDQPCTIRYRVDGPAADLDNNPSDVWTEVGTICSLQQRGRSENPLLGDLPISDWVVVLRPEVTPPAPGDELVVDGKTYQFSGTAWSAYLRGRLDHIEASVGAN